MISQSGFQTNIGRSINALRQFKRISAFAAQAHGQAIQAATQLKNIAIGKGALHQAMPFIRAAAKRDLKFIIRKDAIF